MAVAKNAFNLPTTRSSSIELLLQQPTSHSKSWRTEYYKRTTGVASAEHQDLLPPAPANISLDTTPATLMKALSSSTTSVTCSQEALLNSLLLASYWNSQYACNLFGVQFNAPFNDVRDLLKQRVESLQLVYSGKNGWRNASHGRDPENLCSQLDIFALCGQSMILCLAYQLAMQNLNKWTWEQCCTHACSQLNPLGIEHATHNCTVQDWNGLFRQSRSFPQPNYAV
jgi:hypothetical protein